ncbi:TM2 domain-containing protein [Streptococcus cuniculi]|uniref:TM2 domain-containing protein n=2 Tax=Streptococcus cuniculi TaxID=1432788 RepID=A0A4Y9JDM9_9STRE|nr:TM2 domain-containing protein [Streptococcus cuniculi]TFU98136.1 TM2 domain-containing protein [Streptococcus cuniculi]
MILIITSICCFIVGYQKNKKTTPPVPINKVYYFLLALVAGGLGAHKFYSQRTALGLAYLFLCWTGIPSILAIIEGLMILSKPSRHGDILYL